MTRHVTASARVLAVRGDRVHEMPDRLVTEEPMEIRAAGPGQEPVAVAVTMRTPGHDFELAAGFLFTEGLLRGRDELASVRYCDLPAGAEQEFNVVTVGLRRAFVAPARERSFVVGSSCGICGKTSLDDVEVRCGPVMSDVRVTRTVLVGLPAAMRDGQRLFDQTGGLHAAGLFTPHGELLAVREDVGRHNALDKLVGWALMERRLPLAEQVLVVSGRVSFEIVQKAAAAGIAVIGAVSAPSSLAVDAARRLGITVAGFIRDGSCNIYAHPDRIDLTR